MPVPVNSVQATVVSAGGTSLPTSVIAFATADVQVERQQVDETFVVMASPAEYTVSISPVNQQVTVNLVAATTDITYRVSNVAALAQLSDYTLADYSPARLTRDLDKVYLQLQRLALGTSGGSGSSGAEWGSDFDLEQDGTTDIAPALSTLMEERQLAGIRTTRYVPRQGEPDPYINSFVRVPAGHTFDRSQVSFQRGKLARIGMSGGLVELPELNKYRLVSAVPAGAFVMYLRVPTGGSLAPLQAAAAAGMDLIIRGQNDASGNSIERETIPFTIVDDTDDQNISIALLRPTENAYEVVYPDSDWEPAGPGSDYSLISVTSGGLVDVGIADGDLTISLASVPTGMVAGSTVLLTSDELVPSGTGTLPFGREVHRIRSISGTTVTLTEPVTRAFPLVENPKLLLREPFEGATILCGHRNDTWLEAPDASPASRIDAYTMQYVDDCTIVEPWVDDAGTTYYIRGAGVMDREGYNNRVVDARIFRRTGAGSGDQNGLARYYSTLSRDERSFVVGARHGIVNQGGISPGTFDYVAVDCATNAWDTHGCGTVGATLDGFEFVGGPSLSSDNTFQRGVDVGNTSHRSSDRRTTIRNGTIRGFNFTAGARGLVVRPPSEDTIIQNVHFVDCTTGLMLIIDDRAGAINIDGVTLQGLVYTDCDANLDQSQTDAPAWQTSEAIVGTTARPRYRTANGGLWSATTSFTTGATEPTGTGPTHNDGGGIWNYVTTAANRILNVVEGASIGTNAVTNANLADVATGTLKGRTTAGTGDPEDLTATQVRTLLNVGEIIDEDTLVSDLATHVPSQQSVKSYVDTNVANLEAAIDALSVDATHSSSWRTPTVTSNEMTLSATLDIALADDGAGAIVDRVVRLVNDTPANALTVFLPNDATAAKGKFYCYVPTTQTGAVTLKVEAGAGGTGTVDGIAGGTGRLAPKPGSFFFVICESNGGDEPVYRTSIVDYDDVINFVIDGGGSAITTGIKGDVQVDFDCTIVSATALADQSGSIVVDIWKDTYANFPPTDADSITASAPVTISTATKSTDSTLTGWTTAISAGDILRFNVDSITTCERVTVALKVRR